MVRAARVELSQAFFADVAEMPREASVSGLRSGLSLHRLQLPGSSFGLAADFCLLNSLSTTVVVWTLLEREPLPPSLRVIPPFLFAWKAVRISNCVTDV